MIRAMLVLGAGLGLLAAQVSAQATPKFGDNCVATVEEYGKGCAGSAGRVAYLFAKERPFIGNYEFAFLVDNLCECSAVRVFCSLLPRTIQLANCYVYIEPSLYVWDIGGMTDTGGFAIVPMSIPAFHELMGTELFCQAAVLDFNGEFFQLGSLSNGLHLTFGE